MTWIEQFMQATQESESPPKYFFWSALASISAVLKNSVYLDRGGVYELYPNIFVLLIGPSGIKKGVPINYARRLVTEVDNTRVLAGRMSIQKVISLLSTAYTRPNKDIIKDAVAAMFASEFASFIIQDPAALTILTDLYDTHYNKDGWTNYTKKSDAEQLKNPCITLLGASNEVHFKEAVPPNAVGGGFIARTFIVLANSRGKLNSLVEATNPIDIKNLAAYLKELSLLRGQFQWSPSAKRVYNDWYIEFSEVEKESDETGTLNRITDSVLKVAMLLSASRSTDLIIRDEDITQAVKVCEDTVIGIKRVTMGAGKSLLGNQTAMVIRFLLKQPDYEASRQLILSKHWGHFDAYEFDKIVETLSQAGVLKLRPSSKGPVFRLTDAAIANVKEKS